MDLLNKDEVTEIVKQYGYTNVVSWFVENYSDKLIGYLGEHLTLTVNVVSDNKKIKLNFFVKCLPRFDKWKAEYLRECCFFDKEFGMLDKLFKHFKNHEDSRQWRPRLLFSKEELFVFEDITLKNYVMPSNTETLTYDQIIATLISLARFHAQSYIYEEKRSVKLNKQYRIWDEYGEYLCEPSKGQSWRNTGAKAAIDFLKEFSKYKTKPNFGKRVEIVLNGLFESALQLMMPSTQYRNVVVHRDLWTNNLFFKEQPNGNLHALIIDYQTVIYCPPTLDLSSFLFLNTTKKFRQTYTRELIDFYYKILTEELLIEGINIENIIAKNVFLKAYEESIVFGITQAALLVPITTMTDDKRKETFANPENCVKVNVISRSEEFIDLARENEQHHYRVLELLDDIVERYMYPNPNL